MLHPAERDRLLLAVSSTHMTQHPEQTWFTSQMSRDAFPSRELSLSGSSRCSSQPPSTRRVGSGKLHSTHARSSDWVSTKWRGHGDYSQGAWAHHLVLALEREELLATAPRPLLGPPLGVLVPPLVVPGAVAAPALAALVGHLARLRAVYGLWPRHGEHECGEPLL